MATRVEPAEMLRAAIEHAAVATRRVAEQVERVDRALAVFARVLDERPALVLGEIAEARVAMRIEVAKVLDALEGLGRA